MLNSVRTAMETFGITAEAVRSNVELLRQAANQALEATDLPSITRAENADDAAILCYLPSTQLDELSALCQILADITGHVSLIAIRGLPDAAWCCCSWPFRAGRL